MTSQWMEDLQLIKISPDNLRINISELISHTNPEKEIPWKPRLFFPFIDDI